MKEPCADRRAKTSDKSSDTLNVSLARLSLVSGPIDTHELLKSLELDLMTVVIRFTEPGCAICGQNEPAAEDVCKLTGPGVDRCTTFIRYGICQPCIKRIDGLSPQGKQKFAEEVAQFFEAWLGLAGLPTGQRAQA